MTDETIGDLPTHIMRFGYRNWRGEIGERRVKPMAVWCGVSPFHPDRQWFMRALDLEKNNIRDFAMRDMWEIVCE